MGKYFIPSKGAQEWRGFLADPNTQWKKGYSAYELAHCWEESTNLPSCVKRVFMQSNYTLFHNTQVLYGFPEYKVSLPGGSASSQNDLYILAKTNKELLIIMVEGKVSEQFGETVETWKGKELSDGKRKRLDYLLNLLNLDESNVLNIRYQLLHRTASAIIEANNVGAKNALMLVHSFSEKGKWFEDYQAFVELFNLKPKKEEIVGSVYLNGVNVYFGWVTGKCSS
jgi:hypothetical protein